MLLSIVGNVLRLCDGCEALELSVGATCTKPLLYAGTDRNSFDGFNLVFMCHNRHKIEIDRDKFIEKYQSVKHGEKEGRKFCQDCLLGRQNKYLTTFDNVGIIPVNEYVDRKTEIIWQFPCSHQSLDKAKNINERVKRNHYLCKECCKK